MTRFSPFVLLCAGLVLSAASAPAIVEVQNEFVKIVGDNDSGRFFIKTTGGDPAIPGDQDKLLLNEEYPPTTFATIRIDGYDYKFGEDRGYFTMPMQSRDNAVVCTWSVNNIDVTQLLEFGTGLLTGRQDSVKISYMVANKDFREHQVGVRLCLDVLLGKNDGAPFKVPGVGEITTETFLTNGRVPEYWYTFDDLANPVVRAQGTLKAEGLVPPDRILFAGWGRMGKFLWDFDVIEGRGFIRNVGTLDSAVAIYWNPRNVQPNGRFGVSTMYGLYGEMRLTGDPFRLVLDGPTNCAGEPVILGANLMKLFPTPVEAVSVSMALPEGLAFKAGETAVKDLGTVSSYTTGRQTWIVVPQDGVQGEMEYTVTVKGTVAKKDYRVSATRRLVVLPKGRVEIVEAAPTAESQAVTAVTQRAVPQGPTLQLFQRYYFDFSRIDAILSGVNADLQENNAMIARLNELLKPKMKVYGKARRDADISKAGEWKTKAADYPPRIQASSSNVIRVQNVTNVIQ